MGEGICENIKSVVRTLLTRKCIGGVHTPEDQLFRKFKNIHDKIIRKKIDEDWKQLENCGYLIRMKKRTKKGTDYHVSLNPKKVFEIKKMPTICNLKVAVFKNNLAIYTRLLNFQQVESNVGIFKFVKGFICDLKVTVFCLFQIKEWLEG